VTLKVKRAGVHASFVSDPLLPMGRREIVLEVIDGAFCFRKTIGYALKGPVFGHG
jgi:hypothetical protein